LEREKAASTAIWTMKAKIKIGFEGKKEESNEQANISVSKTAISFFW